MDLRTYLRTFGETERKEFAMRCGTTWGHMKNIAYSGKLCGPLLAVAIERESEQAIRRWELRATDWYAYWPELINEEMAPPTPEPAEAPRNAA